MKRAVALLMVAMMAGCAKRAQQPVRSGKERTKYHRLDERLPDDNAERSSVLALARGATLVSRTGELLPEDSAIRAIDGDPMSFWMPPPHDLPQSMTIALPARTHIEKVGIRTDETLPTKHIEVDASADGVTFQTLTTIASRETVDLQWVDVSGVDASYLRVTLVDRVADDREPRLRSFLARGAELEPPHPGDLAGCWALNETHATFERHGASVAGLIEMRQIPMQLDGGFDGRVYRFNWVRGNDYGYALFSVAPDSRHCSALSWHEEAIPLFYGESWFGEPHLCALGIATDTRERYLRRTGRFSLFGIRFRDDGSIDRQSSAELLGWLTKFASDHPLQLVAHEFRQGNPAANKRFAQRELDALRAELDQAGVKTVTFVAKGSDTPRQEPINDAMRAIYSTVDIEIRR